MLLKDLIAGLDAERVIGEDDVRVVDIDIDSKKVQKNHLFICISGGSYDSHEAAGEAERYGASAVVCAMIRI